MQKLIDKIGRQIEKMSPNKLFKKISRTFRKLGGQSTYMVLLLYYSYLSKSTPGWAKKVVIGAIAYLLLPLDFIPDLAPLLGFTDDLEMLSLSLVTISCYVNEDVRAKAKETLSSWFENVNEEDLEGIDKRL